MKISIELEIAPDEVGLATELLSTLRLLTEHAKAPPPVVANTRELFESLIVSLNDQAKAENAAQEIFKILSDENYGKPEKLTDDLIEAMSAVALSYETIAQSAGGVAPYMSFLPNLPEPYKASVRDKVIGKVLKHVAKPRSTNADRTEFFAHAEAFAVLVKLELGVSIDGAVQTIERLLNKPETRSAAVTMLGKTVELCHQQLLTANPKYLSSLQKVLAAVTESAFVYDIEYITQSMGWSTQEALPTSQPPSTAATPPPDDTAAAAATAAASQQYTAPPQAAQQYSSLQYITHFPVQSKTIYSLAYHPTRMELAAGGRDDTIAIYSPQGEISNKPAIPYENMVCSMDFHPRHDLLAMCGVTTSPTPEAVPCITLYDATKGYEQRLLIPKPQGTILTSLRCFGPDSDCFITGESSPAAPQGSPPSGELICVYEITRPTPVLTFNHHTDLVTCLATAPATPTLFVSGSRDKTVKLWDLRMATPAGNLTGPQGTPEAHQAMITSIDFVDNFVISTGQDCAMCLWDIRMEGLTPMSAMSIDGTCLLRVAMRGAPSPNLAAVTSVGGLFLVDFTNPSAPVPVPATPVAGAQGHKPYHDIRWAAGQPVLYAAGETMRIDIFQAV